MQDRLEACRTQAGEGVAVGDLDVLAALLKAGGQSLRELLETGPVRNSKEGKKNALKKTVISNGAKPMPLGLAILWSATE